MAISHRSRPRSSCMYSILPRLAVNQCGNWKSIAAELADRGQRYQRVGLHLPDERLRLVRHIAEIDAVLFGRRLWQQLLHGFGQPRDRDRVMREQAERFDVEKETGMVRFTQRWALRSEGRA
jgi:hypothetical protein